jgi:leader peptidase (prepilin peptidase) / N-methyltransferase
MFFLNVPIFIWGLLFGSFLNVIIYRLPRNLSIVFPGSFCPHCKQSIPLYRNIPLISFLIQLGKCANCKNKISIRYPAIELINGCLWVLNFQNENISTAITSSILCSCILAIIIIDFEHFIIPFKIVLFSFSIIGLSLIIIPENLNDRLLGILFGVGYLGFVFIATSIVLKKQAMGYGDLIFIGLLGAWLGPVKVFYTIFIGAFLGIIYFTYKLYLQKVEIKELPFGTFLGIASIIINFINYKTLLTPFQ